MNTYEPSGSPDTLPSTESGSASVTQKCPEGCALRYELHALRQWLQWCLETKIESRQVVNYGIVVNSWAAVPIPDWDVKQKIQRIDEVLAATPDGGRCA